MTPHLKIIERDFEKLVRARRNLGLFQHHDAITGTSKSFVMRDYGLKLFEGIRDTVSIQQNALQSLVYPYVVMKPNQNLILSDVERESYDKLPKKTPLQISATGKNAIRKVILYNSLSQVQEQIVQVRTNVSNVKVLNADNSPVLFQINPVWEASDNNANFWISADEYEVVFLAKLQPLSVTTYSVVYTEESHEKLSTIYCNKCKKKTAILNNGESPAPTIKSNFTLKAIPVGDIQLENHKLKLLFNGNTGFMKTITRKHKPKIMQCAIQFAAYRSAQFHSGAYLFMPDPNEKDYEKDVLEQYKKQMSVIITTGPLSSELTIIYGAFLVHSVAIYHVENSSISDAIQIENTVDFENTPKNRETELFMRIISNVQNNEPPEFYTDLNGFSTQKRVKVERIALEGNYFPITSMAYIQDENIRLSLLTNHAQGAASWQPGYLEVMLERRTLYDDSRGMGEGLVDNRKTVSKYFLLIEDMSQIVESKVPQTKRFENSDDTYEKGEVVRTFNVPTENAEVFRQETYSRPSLYSNHLSNLLNYPAGVFIVDPEYQSTVNNSFRVFNKNLPCDVHLLNLRTQPDSVYSQYPSSNALMVLHRQGYDCQVNSNYTCSSKKFSEGTSFDFVTVKDMEVKSLTGIEEVAGLNSLGDMYLEPMALKTLNVSFG